MLFILNSYFIQQTSIPILKVSNKKTTPTTTSTTTSATPSATPIVTRNQIKIQKTDFSYFFFNFFSFFLFLFIVSRLAREMFACEKTPPLSFLQIKKWRVKIIFNFINYYYKNWWFVNFCFLYLLYPAFLFFNLLELILFSLVF